MNKPINLGDIAIEQIVEQELPFLPVHEFFPTLSPEVLEENRNWMEPDHLDPVSQYLRICVQSYIVRTPHHTIMIDSCVGNHKPRPTRPMWDMMKSSQYERNLKAAGLTFEDIDFVMCTHLHTDHVGWNTKLENGRWVPTFPNARYIFADNELSYWTEKSNADPDSCAWMTDSVLPIVEANKAEIVTSSHCLNDHVQLIPSPGHSIDHYSVLVGSPGKDALITGDMVHSQLQARYPELGMFSDHDSAQAGRSRRELLGRFCDTSTLMCTAHFPSPSIGHVTQWDNGFKIS